MLVRSCGVNYIASPVLWSVPAVSLKNACELLELSAFYNAHQLRVTCQQFICLNLAALLESRALDVLSQPVIEQLTQYYRDMVGTEYFSTCTTKHDVSLCM